MGLAGVWNWTSGMAAGPQDIPGLPWLLCVMVKCMYLLSFSSNVLIFRSGEEPVDVQWLLCSANTSYLLHEHWTMWCQMMGGKGLLWPPVNSRSVARREPLSLPHSAFETAACILSLSASLKSRTRRCCRRLGYSISFKSEYFRDRELEREGYQNGNPLLWFIMLVSWSVYKICLFRNFGMKWSQSIYPTLSWYLSWCHYQLYGFCDVNSKLGILFAL